MHEEIRPDTNKLGTAMWTPKAAAVMWIWIREQILGEDQTRRKCRWAWDQCCVDTGREGTLENLWGCSSKSLGKKWKRDWVSKHRTGNWRSCDGNGGLWEWERKAAHWDRGQQQIFHFTEYFKPAWTKRDSQNLFQKERLIAPSKFYLSIYK